MKSTIARVSDEFNFFRFSFSDFFFVLFYFLAQSQHAVPVNSNANLDVAFHSISVATKRTIAATILMNSSAVM